MLSLDEKRKIVLHARLAFTGQLNSARESFIDSIVKQILFMNHIDTGVPKKRISSHLGSTIGLRAISRKDIHKSTDRLIDGGEVVSVGNNLTLSSASYEQINLDNLCRDKEHKTIFETLFHRHDVDKYYEPFMVALTDIFRELGKETASILSGKASDFILNHATIVENVAKKICNSKNLDYSILHDKLVEFFYSVGPKYDKLKWEIAQNCLGMEALNLGKDAHLFSREMFSNAIYYLDTNIIIHALDSRREHYASFQSFVKSCKTLNIRLIVAKITVDELEAWLAYQIKTAKEVIDEVPLEAYSEIDGAEFLVSVSDTTEAESVLEHFQKPEEYLNDCYDISVINDIWFDSADKNNKVQEIAKFVSTRRNEKKDKAVMHDATLLAYIDKQVNETPSSNVKLITLDTSLPKVKKPEKRYALTLDSLLQWLTPLSEQPEENVSDVYSRMLRNRLFPADSKLTIDDFRIFSKMNIDCKKLSLRIVEELIRYIREVLPHADNSSAAGREELRNAFDAFFSRPGTEYSEDLRQANEQVDREREEKESFQAMYEESERKIEALKEQHKQDDKQRENDKQKSRLKKRLNVRKWLLSLTVGVPLIILSSLALFFSDTPLAYIIPLFGIMSFIFVFLRWITKPTNSD